MTRPVREPTTNRMIGGRANHYAIPTQYQIRNSYIIINEGQLT